MITSQKLYDKYFNKKCDIKALKTYLYLSDKMQIRKKMENKTTSFMEFFTTFFIPISSQFLI